MSQRHNTAPQPVGPDMHHKQVSTCSSAVQRASRLSCSCASLCSTVASATCSKGQDSAGSFNHASGTCSGEWPGQLGATMQEWPLRHCVPLRV